MKHNFKITGILLGFFLLAQFLGIAILYQNIDVITSQNEGKTIFKEIPFLERPPVNENISYLPIILAVLIGTGFLLLLMKYNLIWVWKIWFLFAVVISLTIAFGSFIPYAFALLLALTFGFWKIFKPNVIIQNLTELFIYGGLSVIFVPLFNLSSVIILLILISAYDAYAVWKSKHMIKMAKSQSKAKVFAGLLIPYELGKITTKKTSSKTSTKKSIAKKLTLKKINTRVAMLGGGDIAFSIIFAGVVLKEMGLWQSLIIPFFSLLGLTFLFWKSKEKKFYPAMPFISVGCFLGLGLIWILTYLF